MFITTILKFWSQLLAKHLREKLFNPSLHRLHLVLLNFPRQFINCALFHVKYIQSPQSPACFPLPRKWPHHQIMTSCFSYWCSLLLWSCKFCIPRGTKDALHHHPVNSWVVKSPLPGEKPQLEILYWISALNPSLPFLRVITGLPSNYIPSLQGMWRHCSGAAAVAFGHWQEQHWAQLCSPAPQFAWLLGPQRDRMSHLLTPGSPLLPQAMRAFIPAVPPNFWSTLSEVSSRTSRSNAIPS